MLIFTLRVWVPDIRVLVADICMVVAYVQRKKSAGQLNPKFVRYTHEMLLYHSAKNCLISEFFTS